MTTSVKKGVTPAKKAGKPVAKKVAKKAAKPVAKTASAKKAIVPACATVKIINTSNGQKFVKVSGSNKPTTTYEFKTTKKVARPGKLSKKAVKAKKKSHRLNITKSRSH